jgi:hypothetical protein
VPLPLLPRLDPGTYRPHALHGPDRQWQETNCYIDLWIEILHAIGLDPEAALGFTVTQDFEGDQFTFFKFLPEDLETLFGLGVQELAVYDGIEAQIAEQLRRDRLPLVEIDSFYLPDTQATAYRREHVKTTIGAVELDAPARRLGYFHNTGYHLVEGEDFDGLFHRLPHQASNPDLMFPYAEFVKRRRPPLEGADLTEASVRLLRQHLARRPEKNPVSAYRAEFGRHIETLASRPMSYFHLYCFNTARQLGANFELLGSHLRWLDERAGLGLEDLAAGATRIASDAKVLQFQLARSVKRARLDDCGPALERLEAAYDLVIGGLAARLR